MFEIHAKEPDLFHPKDMLLLRVDDTLCRRVVRTGHGEMDMAVVYARRMFSWRKSFGVNDLTEASIQDHLFEAKSLFPYGVTKKGAHILMSRGARHKKPSTPEEIMNHRKFIVYFMDQMVFGPVKANKVCLLFDCQDVSITSVDFDTVKFVITLLKECYPYYLDRIVIYEMSWVLSGAWKVIKKLLPVEADHYIKFMNKKEIKDVVSVDKLPKWMDGECEVDFQYRKGKPLGDMCPLNTEPITQSL